METGICLIQVKAPWRQERHQRRMDESHIQKMIEVMLACHGADAENAARKRANRCLRRKEPEWAALWREVADRLAQRPSPRTPAATATATATAKGEEKV